MALPRGSRKRPFLALPTGQARQELALAPRRPECFMQMRLQNRIGTDLDKYSVARRGQRVGGFGKPDRLANIAPPVIGAEQPGGDRLRGQPPKSANPPA